MFCDMAERRMPKIMGETSRLDHLRIDPKLMAKVRLLLLAGLSLRNLHCVLLASVKNVGFARPNDLGNAR
jgi:hypothetical protein